MIKKVMRTTLTTVSAGLLLLAAAGSAAAQTDKGPIVLATGPASSFYNQAGIALSNLLQKELGVPSSARPFGGTTAYLPQLHRGQVQLGINSGLDAAAAYQGKPPYSQSMDKLRIATRAFRLRYALHASAESGLTSVDQLKGERVVTSYRGVASFGLVTEALLATAGLNPSDITPVEVAGVREGLRLVVDGRAVASGANPTSGTVREADAALPKGIRVLDLGANDEPVNSLAGFEVVEVKPSAHSIGFDKPIRVAQFDVYLNTSTNESEERVYQIVKALHQNWETLQKDVRGFRSVGAADLAPVRVGHPYHDGAIRYFKEIGLWTEAHEKRQRELLN